jgi:pimeloyl-ACP methyl ester carboxylesterase
MGHSETNPALSLASFAADLGVLLNALHIAQVAVLWGRGGGPYAAAAAALLPPGAVTQLHLVSALGPLDGPLMSSMPQGFDKLSMQAVRWRLLWPLAWALQRMLHVFAMVGEQ